MQNVAFVGAHYLPETGDFRSGTILVSAGRIQGILSDTDPIPTDYECVPLHRNTLVPGFIDTHVHGAMGHNFMEATADAVQTISDFMASSGTTGCLVTTTSAQEPQELDAVRALGELCSARCAKRIHIYGIHLEGPFISIQNRGAHKLENIHAASVHEANAIVQAAGGALKVVTLAPEVEGVEECAPIFAEAGVVLSVGHTAADLETTNSLLAYEKVRGTHTFSGMPQIHHRKPGPVVALLLCDRAFLELTVDGKHAAPETIALVLKTAGAERCVLITDGVDVRGLPDGNHRRWEGTEVVMKDGEVRTLSGSLAGSTLTMDAAVRNMVSMLHIPLTDAVRMASENPARSIGVFDQVGSISPGKLADFAVLNEDLQVEMTIVEGKIIYKKEKTL